MNQKHVIPEIYLNHQTIRLLRYIRHRKDCTQQAIAQKFGEDAGGYQLINLCKAGYLVATRPDGSYTMFQDGDLRLSYDFTFWATPKAEKVLDDRFDRLWQWCVPTIISVAALIVSILS